MKHDNDSHFWDIRSDHYDKLFWVKDKHYLDAILDHADLKKSHLALDVGTGTGVVAKAIKKHVKHVVAIDTSDSMLSEGKWENISSIKWNIGESLFSDGIFDRLFARMIFHHILDNLDRAVLRCFDVLKPNGKIIVAEGVPPTNDPLIVDWYTDMFKFKEKRRTFSPDILAYFLKKNGFRNIKTNIYIMDRFNINNWHDNSGLSGQRQKKIYDMHVNADKKIKDAYKMKIVKGECLVRTVNVIMIGQK